MRSAKTERQTRTQSARPVGNLNSATLQALLSLPDEAFVTDSECELITRLSRCTLHRLEHGLDRHGVRAFPPEPLLKSTKMGPKRKVRLLGNLRKFVHQRMSMVA